LDAAAPLPRLGEGEQKKGGFMPKVLNEKIKELHEIAPQIFEMIIEAQIAMPSSGGNASGSSGSMSYTVGQLVYTTNTGTNGTVVQGVQQPYEISVVTGIEDAKDITLEYSVYPNPATDYLILKLNGATEMQCLASLYNISGILLQAIKVESVETTISMQSHLQGTYILKITRGNKEIKTFKIIKK